MIVFMRTGGVWVRLCDPAYEPLRSCHILCLRQGVSMRKPEPLIPWRRLEVTTCRMEMVMGIESTSNDRRLCDQDLAGWGSDAGRG